ncbi:MAG: hypothetical protein ACRDJU_12035 [Actinomycetota bacterium]
MSDSPPPRRPRAEKVPPALRPGETDDVLEGPRLTKISTWGLILSVGLAAMIFLYWVHEPTRMANTTASFNNDSILRGEQYFDLPNDPVTGAQGNGIGCARCHGSNEAAVDPAKANNASGGTNTFIDSTTGKQETATVPGLLCVFYRYANGPPSSTNYQGMYPTNFDFIQATIQHGRTNGILGDGDDMPTWSADYGGPLVDPEITDIINYLESVQKPASYCEQHPQD